MALNISSALARSQWLHCWDWELLVCIVSGRTYLAEGDAHRSLIPHYTHFLLLPELQGSQKRSRWLIRLFYLLWYYMHLYLLILRLFLNTRWTRITCRLYTEVCTERFWLETDRLRDYSCDDLEFDTPSDFELISCLELVEEWVNTSSIEEDRTVRWTSSLSSGSPKLKRPMKLRQYKKAGIIRNWRAVSTVAG